MPAYYGFILESILTSVTNAPELNNMYERNQTLANTLLHIHLNEQFYKMHKTITATEYDVLFFSLFSLFHSHTFPSTYLCLSLSFFFALFSQHLFLSAFVAHGFLYRTKWEKEKNPFTNDWYCDIIHKHSLWCCCVLVGTTYIGYIPVYLSVRASVHFTSADDENFQKKNIPINDNRSIKQV